MTRWGDDWPAAAGWVNCLLARTAVVAVQCKAGPAGRWRAGCAPAWLFARIFGAPSDASPVLLTGLATANFVGRQVGSLRSANGESLFRRVAAETGGALTKTVGSTQERRVREVIRILGNYGFISCDDIPGQNLYFKTSWLRESPPLKEGESVTFEVRVFDGKSQAHHLSRASSQRHEPKPGLVSVAQHSSRSLILMRPPVAFYYPGHLWDSSDWVKTLLLFFDGIGLLVPKHKQEEPEAADPTLCRSPARSRISLPDCRRGCRSTGNRGPDGRH